MTRQRVLMVLMIMKLTRTTGAGWRQLASEASPQFCFPLKKQLQRDRIDSPVSPNTAEQSPKTCTLVEEDVT